MLKELKEKYAGLAHQVKAVMDQSNGKPGEMPADDQEKFAAMVNDLDNLKAQIETAEKAASLHAWGEKSANDIRVAPVLDAAEKGFKQNGDEAKHAFIKYMAGAPLSEAERHTLTVGSDPRGGFLSPAQMINELIILVRDQTFIRGLATNYAVTGASTIEIPVLTADVTLPVNTSEAATSGTDDTALNFGLRTLTPRLREITVPIGRIMSLATPFDIYSIVMASAAYSKGRKEELEFLLGNGADSAMGLLVESVNGLPTTRTVTTGTANAVNFDDFVNVLGGLRGQFRRNARWLIHRNGEARIRKVKDSNNNYVWSPVGTGVYNAQNLTVGMPGTILGLPYDISENMTDPGISGSITTGTMFAILADYAQTYAIADSIDMEVVDLSQRYYPRRALGFLAAYDGQVINANAAMRLKVS